MQVPKGLGPLTPAERIGMVFVVLGWLAFGGLVELRSAFQKDRKTDLGVYLRTAWAVRSGIDIYAIADDRGWHYCYPPLFAIVMTPLADPPRGIDRSGMVPFAVSVAIWYLVSLLCLFATVHWLAAAWERTHRNPLIRATPIGSRRWWWTRMGPIYICLAPIGFTLSRGQVNLLQLMLIAGMVYALSRRQNLTAGFWLAGAICLKIIPAFLVLYPLVRRQGRCLAGVMLGGLIGLGLIPALVWGWEGSWQVNRRMIDAVMRPGLAMGGDPTRGHELIHMKATDNQSFQAILHHHQHRGASWVPPHPATWVRAAHWGVGALLTLITLAALVRVPENATSIMLSIGCLCLVMLHISPSSHMHWYCLGLISVSGLWLRSIDRHGTLFPSGRTLLGLGSFGLIVGLPNLPGWEPLRDGGTAMLGSLGLWAAGIGQLGQLRRETTAESPRHSSTPSYAQAA